MARTGDPTTDSGVLGQNPIRQAHAVAAKILRR